MLILQVYLEKNDSVQKHVFSDTIFSEWLKKLNDERVIKRKLQFYPLLNQIYSVLLNEINGTISVFGMFTQLICLEIHHMKIHQI